VRSNADAWRIQIANISSVLSTKTSSAELIFCKQAKESTWAKARQGLVDGESEAQPTFCDASADTSGYHIEA
jgi:hypothetical protein